MPTNEQLQKFYQVVRQAVLLSSYVAFVELAENGNLYIYVKRYDNPLALTIVSIKPDGKATYDQQN